MTFILFGAVVVGLTLGMLGSGRLRHHRARAGLSGWAQRKGIDCRIDGNRRTDFDRGRDPLRPHETD